MDTNGYVSLGTTSNLSAFLTVGGDSSTCRVLPLTDNVGYVGESTHRWASIYAVNINLNGTANVLGTITTGIWNGTAIADAYIASAATWNAKQGAITLTTTGSSGAATFSSNTLNIPNYSLSGLGGVAGSGTGKYVSKWSGTGASTTITNSLIYDDGTSVIIGDTNAYGSTFNVQRNGDGTIIKAHGSSDNIFEIESLGNAVSGYGNLYLYRGGVTKVFLTANGTSFIGSTLLINTSTPATGTLQVNGTVYATAFYESSDVRLKNIIETNPNVDISNIDVIKFTRTDNDTKQVRYGYSAQQIQSILPEVVTGVDYLNVNYMDVHTLKIAALEKEVSELKAKLN